MFFMFIYKFLCETFRIKNAPHWGQKLWLKNNPQLDFFEQWKIWFCTRISVSSDHDKSDRVTDLESPYFTIPDSTLYFEVLEAYPERQASFQSIWDPGSFENPV